MIIDKYLKKHLKDTGQQFSIRYLPETDEWCVMLDDISAKHSKLRDALRLLWVATSTEPEQADA